MKKKALFFSFLLFFLFPLFLNAQSAINDEAVSVSNQVLLDIYQGILDQQSSFPELGSFGEFNMTKNKDGISTILYETNNSREDDPFSFGVTVSPLDDMHFSEQEGVFSYGFPMINLKISGFQQKHPLRRKFDLMPLVVKHGMKLMEYQQQFLPLKIEIRPVKKEFAVREDVTVDVVLTNVSKRHMIVKSLGAETLFFLINNQAWGTSPLSGKVGGKDKVLKSGEEIVLRLKGESFQEPQSVEISCFYNMSIDGVNPFGKAIIDVVE